ncbi:MAG TPA: hypothetical protein VGR43_12025 [Dehalococcoidia bacterium]|jgi:hypothetical protein|nr:hypothetical protein [Dehalococcoidia bacterium]
MIHRLAATGLGALALIAIAASFSVHRAAADDDLLAVQPIQIDVDVPTVDLPDLTSAEDLISSTAPSVITPDLPLADPLGDIDPLSGDAETPPLPPLPYLDEPQPPSEQGPADSITPSTFAQPAAAGPLPGPTATAPGIPARLRCPDGERRSTALAVVSAAGSAIGPSGPTTERPAPGDADRGGGIGPQILDPFVPSAVRDSLLAVLAAAVATFAAWTWLRYQQREEARLIAGAGSTSESTSPGSVQELDGGTSRRSDET